MPELVPHSTPTPHPLPPSLYAAPPSDPLDDPPAPPVPLAAPPPPEPSVPQNGLQVAAVPPVIDPAAYEEFPTFRETFLVFFTDPTANAATRAFGKLLYDFVLATWGDWPDPPEGMFRASLRAAVADLRHVQGALLEWTGENFAPVTPHEGFLATLGDDIARELGGLADRLERELGSFRGEA